MIDYRYLFVGVLLVYGIYSIREGIRRRKKSDVALGVLCLLAVVAVLVMRAMGIRNR